MERFKNTLWYLVHSLAIAAAIYLIPGLLFYGAKFT